MYGMTQRTKYDLQLEHIVVRIARDYDLPLIPPGWVQPGDLSTPLPVMVERMLRYAVLVLLGDKQGHTDESLQEAIFESARLHTRLYDFLVTRLYASQSGKPVNAHYYDAEEFLVLVIGGSVAPVIEVMGQVIAPFVLHNHRQLRPAYRQMLDLADDVLKTLYTDPIQPLRDGVIERVEPLLTMGLRPLPLVRPDAPPPTPVPPATLPESHPPMVEPPEHLPEARESWPLLPPLVDDDLLPDTGTSPSTDSPGPAQQAADSSDPHSLRPFWDMSDL